MWKRESSGNYVNRNAGVEIYRTLTGWYARNLRTQQTDGPHKTMKAAKLAAYGIV